MPKSTKRAAMAGVAILALLVLPQAKAKELQVVSTFSIISDFARNVGGERIALTTLVPSNGDAHSYEPKATDAVAVGKADVVLANGLHFEGFLDRLVQASGGTAPVIVLTQGVELLRDTEGEHDSHDKHDDHVHNDHDHDHQRDHQDHAKKQAGSHAHDHATQHDHEHDHDHDHEHEHDHATEHAHPHHGEYDPHAWQSVRNAQVYVDNIAKALCAVDAAGCPSYQANAKSYDEKLQALDAQLKAAVARIPADRRTIITSHDAFGYLGHTYGLQFLAPQGLSTGSEASAARIASLIQQIRAQKASAIFLENVSNPRLIQQIANETGMTVGGTLYSDSLSTADGPASTYIDMMRHNVITIRDATLEAAIFRRPGYERHPIPPAD